MLLSKVGEKIRIHVFTNYSLDIINFASFSIIIFIMISLISSRVFSSSWESTFSFSCGTSWGGGSELGSLVVLGIDDPTLLGISTWCPSSMLECISVDKMWGFFCIFRGTFHRLKATCVSLRVKNDSGKWRVSRLSIWLNRLKRGFSLVGN